MKRSLFAIAAVLSLAAAAACAAVAWAGDLLAAAVRGAYNFTVRQATAVVMGPLQAATASQAEPESTLTAAKTFLMRLLSRARPHFSGWRGMPLTA